MLELFLCKIFFESFGNIVGLDWSCGGKSFDHAMEKVGVLGAVERVDVLGFLYAGMYDMVGSNVVLF